jgi:hypothetical protein
VRWRVDAGVVLLERTTTQLRAGNRNRNYGETLSNQACNQPNQEGREEEPSGKNMHDLALLCQFSVHLIEFLSFGRNEMASSRTATSNAMTTRPLCRIVKKRDVPKPRRGSMLGSILVGMPRKTTTWM